ncbi:MAG TPA: prolipoprotein diacylglyceryl transferase [Terriglobia bacterium]|nr:prolipoprotein diacylglyceryl transferase [Terriglobia bacterium]
MHPILISIGSFHLPTYGTLLVLAILGGIFTAMRLGRRAGLDSALILDFCTWLILVALVGAKILMVLTDWSYYRANPGEIFSFSTFMAGGVFYGGFLAALFFTIWYVRVQKLSFWKLADVLAPGVALGQSVGRLGCFSAGCDYGKPTTAPWGVVFTSTFAHEVGGVPLGVRLHPAQLYESITTFIIFGLLLWWFPRKQRDGDIFLGYVGVYAAARFFLEFLRGDEDRGFVFHHLLSTSQFIALLALAGIAVALIWRGVHHGEELSAGPGSRDGRRAPPAGETAAQGRFGQAPMANEGVTAGKPQAVAAAPVPKRAKR